MTTPPERQKELSYHDLCAKVAGRTAVLLVGFSGQGYRNGGAVDEILAALVSEFGPNAAFITGATQDGIGRAYDAIPKAAAERGITGVTVSGIISDAERKNEAQFPAQNGYAFIPDPRGTYECNLPDGTGSANVEILKRARRGVLVSIGGGPIAIKELSEAVQKGIETRMYAGVELAPGRPKPGAVSMLDESGEPNKRLPPGIEVRRAPYTTPNHAGGFESPRPLSEEKRKASARMEEARLAQQTSDLVLA
jgi:hypothetical protein